MDLFITGIGDPENKISLDILSEEWGGNQSTIEMSEQDDLANRLFMGTTESVLKERVVISSDEGVFTAAAMDVFSPETGAIEETYSIFVAQLARAQENHGVALNRSAPSVVGPGENSFNITINGHNHELNMDGSATDTNWDVLQRIAQIIHNESLGVSAEILEDIDNNRSQIKISSEKTGSDQAFIIFDLTGNVVEGTGMDSISQTAQNALYDTDGEEQSSGSNIISLDNGLVTVSLAGLGAATLTVRSGQSGQCGDSALS